MAIINKYIFGLGLAAMALTTACDDQSTEITDIDYSRPLSPIGMEAKAVNNVDVNLEWKSSHAGATYSVRVYAEDSCSYKFEEHTLAAEVNGIEGTSVTIKGLESETQFTAYMAATVDGVQSAWHGVEFETGSAQYITGAETDWNWATITWKAGVPADTMQVKWTDEDKKGHTLKFPVSEEEAAAGQMTIRDIIDETDFEVKLMGVNDKGVYKTMGKYSIKTKPSPAKVPIMNDKLKEVLEIIEDGGVIRLDVDTFRLTNEAGELMALKLSKSVTIQAGDASKPLPVLNANIQLLDGAKLTIKNVILDGKGLTACQAFDFKTADATYESLVVENCVLRNYTKGVFYLNVAATVGNISFNNCIFDSIKCDGGDMFDSRAGYIANLSLTNSTIFNSCAARDLIRYDDKSSSFPGVEAPQITVDHCTINGVCEAKRILYVRFAGNQITFTNNIVANVNSVAGFSNQKSTDAEPTFGGNFYFKSANFISAGEGATAVIFDAEGSELAADPFKDAAKGDFSVVDSKIENAGDPRWLNK